MFGRTMLDEMNDFRRSFDRVFENFYGGARTGPAQPGNDWAFTPLVETGWTDDYLNLRVVLPAVSEKDLKISVQGAELTIQGERRAPEKFGQEGFYRLPYGKFERTLELPGGLDLEHLNAHLHDGVLDIRIPVAQAAKPRQIQVTSGPKTESKTLAA